MKKPFLIKIRAISVFVLVIFFTTQIGWAMPDDKLRITSEGSAEAEVAAALGALTVADANGADLKVYNAFAAEVRSWKKIDQDTAYVEYGVTFTDGRTANVLAEFDHRRAAGHAADFTGRLIKDNSPAWEKLYLGEGAVGEELKGRLGEIPYEELPGLADGYRALLKGNDVPRNDVIASIFIELLPHIIVGRYKNINQEIYLNDPKACRNILRITFDVMAKAYPGIDRSQAEAAVADFFKVSQGQAVRLIVVRRAVFNISNGLIKDRICAALVRFPEVKKIWVRIGFAHLLALAPVKSQAADLASSIINSRVTVKNIEQELALAGQVLAVGQTEAVAAAGENAVRVNAQSVAAAATGEAADVDQAQLALWHESLRSGGWTVRLKDLREWLDLPHIKKLIAGTDEFIVERKEAVEAILRDPEAKSVSNSQQKEKRSEINGQHAIVRNLIRKFGIGHESAALVAARHPEDADEWLTLNHLRTARSIEDEFTAGLFYQIERLNISAAILAGKPQGYKITKAEVAIITEQIIKNEHLAPYKHTAYLTARYVALKVIAEEDGGEPLSLRRTEKELAKYSSVLHTFDDIHNVAIVYNPSNEVSVHNKEGNVIDSYRFGGDGFLVRRVGPDLVLTLIFDVAGHDIWVSALKAAILRKFKEEARVAVHSTSHRKREDSGKILEETANSMNRYICRLCDLMDEHSRFVTAEATVIDYRLRELHHLSAGQQSRSLVTSDGQLITHEGKIIDSNGVVGVSAESAVGAGNPLMGIMPNLRYDSTRLKMGPSITAYYSTDGTIEKASIDIDGRVAKLTEDMLSGIVYNGVKDASAARYPGERATVADSIMQIFERIKGPDDKTFIAVELPGEFDAMLDVVGRRIIEKVRQKSRQNIRYFAIVIDSESRSRHLLASQLTEAGYEVAPIETESRLESAREALGIVDGDFVLIFNRNISGGLLSLSGMEPLLIDNQLLKNVDRYLKETVEAYLQSV